MFHSFERQRAFAFPCRGTALQNRASGVLKGLFPAVLLLCATLASAQYPARPVRVYVPNPPGGATDTLARLLSPKMAEGLGQPVLVDNRSGSNGNVATEMTGKASPDGYSLLLGADAQVVISPHLYAMQVDPIRDLVPVSSLVSTHMVLAVIASLPVKNLADFIDYARNAKPPIAYASIGTGSQHHLAMEMLKSRAGIEMVHIPYKGGGPATLAILAGEVPVMFGGNSVSGQIKAGKLRAIAIAGKRAAAYPDLPPLSDTYPGLEVTPWLGMFAPAGVPAPVLARLRGEFGRLLADGEIREKLRGLGGLEPFITTPEEFTAYFRSEYAKYGQVVKAVGVKID
jgi:tripartite-type tricarboxylate transporter receptor subunit TctC